MSGSEIGHPHGMRAERTDPPGDRSSDPLPRAGDPDRDEQWNRKARNETNTERLDRNLNSLLQELRVTQTGVQLLTGFLLILPFQRRFESLSDLEVGIFLFAVLFAILATMLLVAPVALHRILFRRHQVRTVVTAAHRCALAGVVCLGLALTCVVAITVSVATDREYLGLVAGGSALAAFVAFWLIWPWWLRH